MTNSEKEISAKEYFEYCLAIENLSNIKLVFKNKPTASYKARFVMDIVNNEYTIIINKSKFKDYLELFISIMHEIEHAKTFIKTQEEGFIDYEKLVSLLEYFSYLNKYNIKYEDINKLAARITINKEMARNYKTSISEISSNYRSYKKAFEVFNEECLKEDVDALSIIDNNATLSYAQQIPVDCFPYILIGASKYIEKNSNLINKYKALKLIYNEHGKLYTPYELYKKRTEENKDVYDKFILELLLYSGPKLEEEDQNYINYVTILVNDYIKKAITYYKNIDKVKLCYGNKYGKDNLSIMEKRVIRCERIIKENKLNKTSGIIVRNRN